MKQGRNLFVAATAAEAKAAAEPARPDPLTDVRVWLAGQALVGLGPTTPSERGLAAIDMTRDQRLAARARYAVDQADAMLAALGLGSTGDRS